MTDDWSSAHQQWVLFLNEVDAMRWQLNCSISSAWFRGHKDSTYRLFPSLFRDKVIDRKSADARRSLDQIAAADLKQRRIRDELLPKLKVLKQQNSSEWRQGGQAEQRVAEEYRRVKARLRELEKDARVRDLRKKNILAVHYGERDAFIDYRFRTQTSRSCSWETLAEMQHHKVPTRLLDWTEVLALALYFALENYFGKLEAIWREDMKERRPMTFVIPDISETPCVWILNPYALARRSYLTNTIPDLTIDTQLDYYERFFVKQDWPYEKPIPSYSPWKNPRLAAQQGMFTVHGLSREPLDKQLAECVEVVPMSPAAAVYGVRHLKTFLGLDEFVMYRDSDSLGRRIKQKFINPAGEP